MSGTKDAAQCFDVASENATTVMGYENGNVSPCVKLGDDGNACSAGRAKSEELWPTLGLSAFFS